MVTDKNIEDTDSALNEIAGRVFRVFLKEYITKMESYLEEDKDLFI